VKFEVARLVARGLTNREIAEELHITARATFRRSTASWWRTAISTSFASAA
jgi:FixJ family two-component response regulator